MTSCNTCEKNSVSKASAICPVNGQPYKQVPRQTVLHHIRTPWNKTLSDQTYYFCTDTNCNVVYFAEDNSRILHNEMREPVGQKSEHPQRIICYCFDIKLSDIKDNPQQRKQFVIEQTRQSQCDCQIRNPSGKCCLKDFPK